MSKTPEAKAAYAVRREMRIRRDKTCAMLMPFFLEEGSHVRNRTKGEYLEDAANAAIAATDILLARLDATRRKDDE